MNFHGALKNELPFFNAPFIFRENAILCASAFNNPVYSAPHALAPDASSVSLPAFVPYTW